MRMSAAARLLGLCSNPAEGMDVCLLWILCVVHVVVSATGWSLVQRSGTDCACAFVVSFTVIKHNNNPLHLQWTGKKDHAKMYVTTTVNVFSGQKKYTSRYTARVAKNMPSGKTLRNKCSEKVIESWFVLLCKRPHAEGITLPKNIASAQHKKLAWWLYTEEDVECWDHCRKNIRISQVNTLLLA